MDDRSGQSTVLRLQPGDRAAAWIRWIHEGSHSGPVWAVIAFLTGVFPTIFAVTGIIMWLRKRAANPQLRPAE
ncbi:MAG TPA: PepSY domain-containing protein [Pseudolabrys sp.]|nr:PepSY domain-containing protein [Pseudolabrys sp.]